MEENVLAYEQQPVDNSAKEKKKNKTKKVIATTTYFIAMLCLLAGLFVPLFSCIEGVAMPERMMFRYLPSMVNGIAGKELIKLPEGSYFLTYYGYTEGKFNFMSLVGVLYAVVCVISVLMLIPILLGSKKKNSSARCALGVEVLAMLVTLVYIAYTTYFLVEEKRIDPEMSLYWKDFNFLIAFGGALLMAIIQTVSSKGSIGVSKVIALLLSVVGVIALLDITLFIKELKEPLTNLPEIIGGGSAPSFLGGGDALGTLLGIDSIIMLTDIKNTIELFKVFAQGGADGILVIVILVLLILVAVFTVLNLVSDVIGLSTGKKFKKDRSPSKNGASNSFALTRYILTLIFAAAIIVIMLAVPQVKDSGMRPGVYLWLLVVVLFISLVNAAIRTAVDNARYKKGTVAPTEEAQQRLVLADPAFDTYEQTPAPAPAPAPEALPVYEEPMDEPVYEPETIVAEPEYVQPDYMPQGYAAEPVAETEPVEAAPATEPEVVAEPEPVEPAPVVEPLSAPLEEPAEPVPTVYIYGGATDEFMDTLTDNEKVEFVELFIKKSKGTVNGVPDYEIDGDNSDFFPAVFVHINRYRNIVSDALMTKMYKQLGKQM